ncbi:MAG: hypothetical protein R3A44_24855 [Caldilineaceae bacterium]
MISTVTTTTVTTVYTATSIGIILTLTLLALLVQKELASAGDKPVLKAFSRVLNVAIVPLLMGFAFIVAMKVFNILG